MDMFNHNLFQYFCESDYAELANYIENAKR